jgi:uncharacterized protein (DUF488 family)
LLKETQDFQLNTKYSFLRELNPSDKKALLGLKASGLRGNRLVKRVYWENPQYTARSEILDELFNSEEIRQLKFTWSTDKTPLVFTVGYEGLTIDAFLNKLIANNIMVIVDVRNNPQSMKFGFSKKRFRDYVEKAGMRYTHIPELGIPSDMRKGLGTTVTHESLFQMYETDLLPKQEEAKVQLLNLIDNNPRIALVCFESDYHFCHRHRLVEYLQREKGLTKPVKHI